MSISVPGMVSESRNITESNLDVVLVLLGESTVLRTVDMGATTIYNVDHPSDGLLTLVIGDGFKAAIIT